MGFIKRNAAVLLISAIFLGLAIFLVVGSMNKDDSANGSSTTRAWVGNDSASPGSGVEREPQAYPVPPTSFSSPSALPLEGHGVRPDYDPEQFDKPKSTVGPSYAPDSGSRENQAPVTLGDWKIDVEKFVIAYLDKSGDQESWIEGMKPYSSVNLNNLLKTVDVENIQADTLDSLRLREDNGVGTVAFDVIGKDNGYIWSGTAQNAGGERWVVTTVDGKL